jgi:8-oxo-dGTP diphosphatase
MTCRGAKKMKLATLCYLRRNGQTLMLHRNKNENDMHLGKWNGLGGKLENGESPEECAIREIREESGYIAKNPTFRGMITFPKFSNDEDWYVFLFVVTDFDGQWIDSAEGHLQWIPDDEILDLPLWEGDRIFIPWLERPEIFSGKFVYHDGQLKHHEVVFYPSC